MYEKLGGKFFFTWEDFENGKFLSSDEYSTQTDYKIGCVCFDNEVVTEFASRESPKPMTIEEYLQKDRGENQSAK